MIWPHGWSGTFATFVMVAWLSRHVLRDGRLTHGDPQLLQFAVNPRRTPERIRRGHSTDQRADVWSRGWTTGAVPTLPGPEQAEAASVPGEDGLRLDEDKRRPPTAPCARQPRPEHPIRRGQTKSRGARAIQDRQLMPEREDLEVQRRA